MDDFDDLNEKDLRQLMDLKCPELCERDKKRIWSKIRKSTIASNSVIQENRSRAFSKLRLNSVSIRYILSFLFLLIALILFSLV